MRKILLYPLVLLACLALVSCESDRSILSGALETEFATCSERLVTGELESHEARASCDHWSAVGATHNWAMIHRHGDLVALLTTKRKEVALSVDAGTLTWEEADTKNNAFYAQFLEEITEREKRYDAGFPLDYLNYCEIAEDNLQCTRPPGPEDLLEIRSELMEECAHRASDGEIVNAEQRMRCEVAPVLEWRRTHQLINNDLAELLLDLGIRLARQYDAGKISFEQFVQEYKAFGKQSDKEALERNRLRTSGDLNWPSRKCQIIDGQLRCNQV